MQLSTALIFESPGGYRSQVVISTNFFISGVAFRGCVIIVFSALVKVPSIVYLNLITLEHLPSRTSHSVGDGWDGETLMEVLQAWNG